MPKQVKPLSKCPHCSSSEIKPTFRVTVRHASYNEPWFSGASNYFEEVKERFFSAYPRATPIGFIDEGFAFNYCVNCKKGI